MVACGALESFPTGVWPWGAGLQNPSLFACTMDSLSGKDAAACGWKEHIGGREGGRLW